MGTGLTIEGWGVLAFIKGLLDQHDPCTTGLLRQ